MNEIKLLLQFPVKRPLKQNEKETLITDIISSFKIVGISDAKVVDSYYVDKRAMPEPLTIAFAILTASADIATIAMAIRTFLRERKVDKEIILEVGSLKLSIRGNMADKEIIKLVKESGKNAEKKK